jgi:hypothetical protein
MPEIDETQARKALVATANTLRRCLVDINRYGDIIDSTIAFQSDGCVYGEVYDGYKALIHALYGPDDNTGVRASEIIDAMFDNDMTVEEAERHVYDQNAPMREYTAVEITQERARYQRWLLCLDDGVLDVASIIGGPVENPSLSARRYLEARIEECDRAIAYRDAR